MHSGIAFLRMHVIRQGISGDGVIWNSLRIWFVLCCLYSTPGFGTKLHRKSDQMSGRTDSGRSGKRKGRKHQDRTSSGQVDGERERGKREGAQRGASGAGGWLQALRGHAGIYSQINNSTLNKPPWTGETDPPRHMWARIYKCLHPLRKRGEAVDPARYLQWAPEVNKMWMAFLWTASFPHHSLSTPFFSYLKDPGRRLFSFAHEPILRCIHSIYNQPVSISHGQYLMD